ncbi:uncharacterized protein [Halyomorpha halys]|uniref:uncharacterized protein n=1 Tax=Halyomorpha halys TaxID=286706 RepID=UPI0006D52568|nr:uncharacterized protein LOC106685889 [Halyomorpha halys]
MVLKYSHEHKTLMPSGPPGRRWHKMLVRPQQLGLEPKKKIQIQYGNGTLGGCTMYWPVRKDEKYHPRERLEKGDPHLPNCTIKLFYYEEFDLEEDESTIDEDELEFLSIAGSEEDFEDIIDDEKYWSCDEEELEFYTPFENSDDEVGNENGECMMLGTGETILHRPMNINNIKKFLYLGYDIHSRDAYKETPLHLAIRCWNLDLTKTFISAGANVNAQNQCGQNPLILAIENRCSMEIIRELLNAGANYSSVMDYFKEQVMHYAWNGELVFEFSKRGAKINIRDKYGYTPLHRACRNFSGKSPPCATQELIRLGAEVNCLDDNGKPPIYHAVLSRRWDILPELVKGGADLTQTVSDRYSNDHKCTILDKALLGKNKELGIHIIKALLWRNWAHELDYTNINRYVMHTLDNSYVLDYVDKFVTNYVDELTRMRKHMIGEYSLFDIIRTRVVYKKTMLLYMDNLKHIDEIHKLFPYYYLYISEIINDFKSRTDLLAKLKQNRISVGSRAKETTKSVILNYDCIYSICEHLSVKDMSNFLSC